MRLDVNEHIHTDVSVRSLKTLDVNEHAGE